MSTPQDQLERELSDDELVDHVGREFQIPRGLRHSLFKQESGGRQSVRGKVVTSPTGARGFGQLMPATAREMGVNPDDKVENIVGSAAYLRKLYDQAKPTSTDDAEAWGRAVAGYFSGPGNMGRRPGQVFHKDKSDGRVRVSQYVEQVLGRWADFDGPDNDWDEAPAPSVNVNPQSKGVPPVPAIPQQPQAGASSPPPPGPIDVPPLVPPRLRVPSGLEAADELDALDAERESFIRTGYTSPRRQMDEVAWEVKGGNDADLDAEGIIRKRNLERDIMGRNPLALHEDIGPASRFREDDELDRDYRLGTGVAPAAEMPPPAAQPLPPPRPLKRRASVTSTVEGADVQLGQEPPKLGEPPPPKTVSQRPDGSPRVVKSPPPTGKLTAEEVYRRILRAAAAERNLHGQPAEEWIDLQVNAVHGAGRPFFQMPDGRALSSDEVEDFYGKAAAQGSLPAAISQETWNQLDDYVKQKAGTPLEQSGAESGRSVDELMSRDTGVAVSEEARQERAQVRKEVAKRLERMVSEGSKASQEYAAAISALPEMREREIDRLTDEEMANRLEAQRRYARAESLLTEEDRKEIRRKAEDLKETNPYLRSTVSQFLFSTGTAGEDVVAGVSRAAEDIVRATGLSDSSPASDYFAKRAHMMRSAVETADREKPLSMPQKFLAYGADLLGNVAVMAAASELGGPKAAFGGVGFFGSLGRGEDYGTATVEGVKGLAYEKVFRATAGMPIPQRGATMFAASVGIEKATGAKDEDAIKAGATNALFAVLPGLKEAGLRWLKSKGKSSYALVRTSPEGSVRVEEVRTRPPEGTIETIEVEPGVYEAVTQTRKLLKGAESARVETGVSEAAPAPETSVERQPAPTTETVSHPNPEIDGKPIVARTGDGRVVVPNESNKGGVSVVKPRESAALRPVTAEDIGAIKNFTGEHVDQAARVILASPDRDKILAEIGSAVAPEQAELGQPLVFTRDDGSRVLVRLTTKADVEPGEKMFGRPQIKNDPVIAVSFAGPLPRGESTNAGDTSTNQPARVGEEEVNAGRQPILREGGQADRAHNRGADEAGLVEGGGREPGIRPRTEPPTDAAPQSAEAEGLTLEPLRPPKPPTRYQATGIKQSRLDTQVHSASEALRRMGGIQFDRAYGGELRYIGNREGQTSGLVKRDSGMSVELAAQALREQGYPVSEDPNEFLSQVADDLSGTRKIYSTERAYDPDEVFGRTATSEEREAEARFDSFRADETIAPLLTKMVYNGSEDLTDEELRTLRDRADSANFRRDLEDLLRTNADDPGRFTSDAVPPTPDRAPQSYRGSQDDSVDEPIPFSARRKTDTRQQGFALGELLPPPTVERSRELSAYDKSQAEYAKLEKSLSPELAVKVRGFQEEDQPQAVRSIGKLLESRAPVVESLGDEGRQRASDLLLATSKLRELKRTRTPVSDYLSQGNLFGDRELTPRQEAMLAGLEKNHRQTVDEYLPEPKKEESQGALFSATKTPEFKKWFEGSKVAYPNGEPLTVYHGSNRRFNVFESRAAMRNVEGGLSEVQPSAFFFSADRDTSRMYARDRALIDERLRGKSAGRPEVRAFHLSIKNPLDFTIDPQRAFEQGFSPYYNPRGINPEAADLAEQITGRVPEDWNDVQALLDGPAFVDELKAEGYDGARLLENDGSETWAAFEPTQIKSVRNRGTFSPDDPNILHSLTGEQAEQADAFALLNDLDYSQDAAGRVKVNPSTAEFMARLAEQMELEKHGGDMSKVGPAQRFTGQTLYPVRVGNTVKMLKRIAEALPEHKGKLKGLALALRDSQVKGGVALLYTDAASVPHEELHRLSVTASNFKPMLDRVDVQEGMRLPAFWRARDVLIDEFGYPESDALLIEETAAHLFEGRGVEFGVSEDDAVEFLDWWLSSFEARNGRISPEAFDRLMRSREEFLPDVRTGFGQRREGVQGLAGGGQGGLEGAPSPGEGRARYGRVPAPVSAQTESAAGPAGVLSARRREEVRAPEPQSLGFFSQLYRTIESKMPERASASQVRALVTNPQSGVKPDEVKWTGFDDFVRRYGDKPVPKREALDFLRSNAVKVEEVVKGEHFTGLEWREAADGKLEAAHPTDTGGDKFFINRLPDGRYRLAETNGFIDKFDSLEDAQRRAGELAAQGARNSSATKFSQYTLPGAKEGSYRELLLTLPDASKPLRLLDIEDSIKTLLARRDAIDDSSNPEWIRLDDKLGQLQDERRALERASDNQFKSSHYDEPNILAHVRFNERRDAEGKRVLFVEEIQSDWHQEGRKKGYGEAPEYQRLKSELDAAKARQRDAAARRNTADEEFNRVGDEYSEIVKSLGEHMPLRERSKIANDRIREKISKASAELDAANKAFAEAESVTRAAQTAVYQAESQKGVPDAPFKKTWHELAMKRILRYAAENGYDRVAWTKGETQAARYDLSKQVRSIEWDWKDRNAGTKTVSITPSQGNVLEFALRADGVVTGLSGGRSGLEFDGKHITDVVGKEIGEKMLADSHGDLSGDGLKVGGEGMKGFYDRILPSFAQKYGRKWKAPVGETEFAATVHEVKENENQLEVVDESGQVIATTDYDSEAYRIARENPGSTVRGKGVTKGVVYTAHSIDITPQMRRSVTEEGQPLFSATKQTGGEARGLGELMSPLESEAARIAARYNAPPDLYKRITPLLRRFYNLSREDAARLEEIKNRIEPEQPFIDLTGESVDSVMSARKGERGAVNFGELYHFAVDLANAPRSLMSSADLSAPLRQGAIFTVTEPRIAARATRNMLKSFVSTKAYNDVGSYLATHPDSLLAEGSGLYLSILEQAKVQARQQQVASLKAAGQPIPKNLMNVREEQFMSRLAGKLPHVKYSEQAYLAYLDTLRLEAFSKYAAELLAQGKSPTADADEFKAVARFINIATGRGELGKLEGAAPELATILFSPRFLASRFQLLNPMTVAKMPPAARRIAARKMFEAIGLLGLTLLLMKLAGADVSLDPDSPDFAKARFGDTRLDFAAGFQQVFRFGYRFVKSALDKDSRQDPVDLTKRFVESKLAPIPKLAVEWRKDKDAKGEKFTWTGAAKERLLPMIADDMQAVLQGKATPAQKASIPLQFFGVGAQTYKEKSKGLLRPPRPPRPPKPPKPRMTR